MSTTYRRRGFIWRPGSAVTGFLRWLTLVWAALFELVLLIALFLGLYGRWPNDAVAPARPGNLTWFNEIFFVPVWYSLAGVGALIGLLWFLTGTLPFQLMINPTTAPGWLRAVQQIMAAEPLTRAERRIIQIWALINLLAVLIFPLAWTRFPLQLAVQLLAILETGVVFAGVWLFIQRSIRWIRRNPQQLINIPLSTILRFLINNRGRP